MRQRQELFYLPDLSEMEVQFALNESVVNRVTTGMRAKIRLEALPDLELDGEIVTIGQFPASPGRDGEDFRNFMGRVKLDKSVSGLTPGMSTRIDIKLPRRNNVLAIPLESIKSAKGQKVCYVAHEESLEQRPIELGPETTSMVEITVWARSGRVGRPRPTCPPIVTWNLFDIPPTTMATRHPIPTPSRRPSTRPPASFLLSLCNCCFTLTW